MTAEAADGDLNNESTNNDILTKLHDDINSVCTSPQKTCALVFQSNVLNKVSYMDSTPEKKDSVLLSNVSNQTTNKVIKFEETLFLSKKEEHIVEKIAENYDMRQQGTNESHENKTAEKSEVKSNLSLNHLGNESQLNLESEVEEKMISEVEQAKQLMFDTENYLKALEKTPVKQNSSQNSSLSKCSPGTPGRHKRVNLITLDSPKTKKLKPNFN